MNEFCFIIYHIYLNAHSNIPSLDPHTSLSYTDRTSDVLPRVCPSWTIIWICLLVKMASFTQVM